MTVTKEFTTDKRKIESVAAPTVPENNTFTAYYGYDGYDTTPISGTNTELGKTATVTFEGTTSPTTEDMAGPLRVTEEFMTKRRKQRISLGGQSLNLH